MLIEYTSEYPTSTTSTIPTYKPSSNPISHPSLDPYDLKQGIQQSQASKSANKYNTVHHEYNIIFILKKKIHLDVPMR